MNYSGQPSRKPLEGKLSRGQPCGEPERDLQPIGRWRGRLWYVDGLGQIFRLLWLNLLEFRNRPVDHIFKIARGLSLALPPAASKKLYTAMSAGWVTETRLRQALIGCPLCATEQHARTAHGSYAVRL